MLVMHIIFFYLFLCFRSISMKMRKHAVKKLSLSISSTSIETVYIFSFFPSLPPPFLSLFLILRQDFPIFFRLELAVQSRLLLSLQFFCLSLPSTCITGMHHHTRYQNFLAIMQLKRSKLDTQTYETTQIFCFPQFQAHTHRAAFLCLLLFLEENGMDLST